MSRKIVPVTRKITPMSRRRFMRLTGLGAVSLYAAACGQGGTGTTAESPAASPTGAAAGSPAASPTDGATAGEIQANLSSVTVGESNPNYAAQMSYQLAAAQGYLEEVGIEEQEVTLSDQYIPGLIGGSLNIVHSDSNIAFGSAAESGEPITVVSCYRQNEWQIMGVRPGIETAEDLVGGTGTGGQIGSRNEAIQKRILSELGLDPETDMEFVPTTGASDQRLQALLNGTVDAASVFPRHRFALEEAGGQFLYEELIEAPQEVFAVMGGWLEENSDTVLAWLTADIRARQYMFDLENQDEVLEIMRGQGFEIPPEFADLYEVEIDQISPDGGFEPEAMDELVALEQEIGNLPEDLEWRDYVDLTLLWAAQEANGLPRRPESV